MSDTARHDPKGHGFKPCPLKGRHNHDSPLEVMKAGEHRFDVKHRRAVNDFNGADPQPIPDDLADSDAMKAKGIWPVRRSRCKYSGKWTAPVRARMDLEHFPPGPVQPRYNDDVVARPKSVKSLCGE